MAGRDPKRALFDWFRAQPWTVWVNISLERNDAPRKGTESFIEFLKQAARGSRAHQRWAFVVGLQPVRDVVHFHGAGMAMGPAPRPVVLPRPFGLNVRAEDFVPGRRSVEYLDKHGVIHHGVYCPRLGCRRRGCRYERPPGGTEILEHLR